MKFSNWAVLILTLSLIFGSLVLACSGDDDDNDNNDDEPNTGAGICYIQCDSGCPTSTACLSPFTNADECAQWATDRCQADGCAAANYEFVAGCQDCSACGGAPDWYEG